MEENDASAVACWATGYVLGPQPGTGPRTQMARLQRSQAPPSSISMCPTAQTHHHPGLGTPLGHCVPRPAC